MLSIPEIREAVFLYYHSIGFEDEKTSLAALLAVAPARELLIGIDALIKAGDSEDINKACLALRDLTIMTAGVNGGPEFRTLLPAMPVVQTLEALVLFGNSRARRDAIYTLGKTGSVQSLPVLYEAVGKVLPQDPLVLDRLFFEIIWMESSRECTWSLLKELLQAPDYIIRWAALDHAERYSLERRLEASAQLCHDEHPWVRAQAIYAHDKAQWEQYSRANLSKAESKAAYKKRRAAGALTPPEPGFCRLDQLFNNFLWLNQLSDYTRLMLDDFIAHDFKPSPEQPN